jgi:protein subunit release factor A
MAAPDFWSDKAKAQAAVKELQDLKAELEGAGAYDRGGNAILSIVAGAGGDDAEDFAAMLFSMYQKFIEKRGWGMRVLHENKNDHGGYRNLSIEIEGKNSYGTLKNEYGVHRLVRISPFNANQKRQTSFVLVEVLPVFEKVSRIDDAGGRPRHHHSRARAARADRTSTSAKRRCASSTADRHLGTRRWRAHPGRQ